MGFHSFLSATALGTCPGGLCEFISNYSEILLVILLLEGFTFFVTLIPVIFPWKSNVDGKSRIIFAFLACVTFYLWLGVLILNSALCFGFLAHSGPCSSGRNLSSEDDIGSTTETTSLVTPNLTSSEEPTFVNSSETPQYDDYSDDNVSEPAVASLSANFFVRNISCTSQVPGNRNVTELKNVTLINCIIILVLIIVLLANAREALSAKALYHKETLCNKDEVRKFLSGLISKRPEVGHLVNCFHSAKTRGKTQRKVITFSAIENFGYETWRDFSDVRLIDPSAQYPVIEIDIVLNFFPGDHFTAEKYKSFVTSLTKSHSSKDSQITIDDYFHIEDQREWTFFIGNPVFIIPWWDRMPFKGILSCGLLFGWPLRARYKGRMAKHRIEIKKAVFCEEPPPPEGGCIKGEEILEDSSPTSPPAYSVGGEKHPETKEGPPKDAPSETSPVIVEEPPPPSPSTTNKIPSGGVSVYPPGPSSATGNCLLRGAPPLRSAPITSPRTHIRETTKDIVTAVTHHDINGVNSTVTLKDIDVKMSTLSGYETYV